MKIGNIVMGETCRRLREVTGIEIVSSEVTANVLKARRAAGAGTHQRPVPRMRHSLVKGIGA